MRRARGIKKGDGEARVIGSNHARVLFTLSALVSIHLLQVFRASSFQWSAEFYSTLSALLGFIFGLFLLERMALHGLHPPYTLGLWQIGAHTFSILNT
jgi:hypothetical protein